MGPVSHLLTWSIGGCPEPLGLLLSATVRRPAFAVSVSVSPPELASLAPPTFAPRAPPNPASLASPTLASLQSPEPATLRPPSLAFLVPAKPYTRGNDARDPGGDASTGSSDTPVHVRMCSEACETSEAIADHDLLLDFTDWGVLGLPSHGYVTVRNVGPLARRVTTWSEVRPPPAPSNFVSQHIDPHYDTAHTGSPCICRNPDPEPDPDPCQLLLDAPFSSHKTPPTAWMAGSRSSTETAKASPDAHGSHVTGCDARAQTRGLPAGKGRALITESGRGHPRDACAHKEGMSQAPGACQTTATASKSRKPVDAKPVGQSQAKATLRGTGRWGTQMGAGEAMFQRQEVRSPVPCAVTWHMCGHLAHVSMPGPCTFTQNRLQSDAESSLDGRMHE